MQLDIYGSQLYISTNGLQSKLCYIEQTWIPRKFLQKKKRQQIWKFLESDNGFYQRYIIGSNKSMNEMTCDRNHFIGNNSIVETLYETLFMDESSM